ARAWRVRAASPCCFSAATFCVRSMPDTPLLSHRDLRQGHPATVPDVPELGADTLDRTPAAPGIICFWGQPARPDVVRDPGNPAGHLALGLVSDLHRKDLLIAHRLDEAGAVRIAAGHDAHHQRVER